MTSNLGARIIEKATPLGFYRTRAEDAYQKIKDNVLQELKRTFNPEFLNRVDEIVVFHPLDKEHLISIVDLLVVELNKQLVEHKLSIELDHSVKEWLIEKYYQPAYGARRMRRALQREIEDPLSEDILRGKFKEADRVTVILEGESPAFAAAEDEPILCGIN